MTLSARATKGVPADLASLDYADLVRERETYKDDLLAGNTISTYSSHWNQFRAWAELHGHPSQPADAEAVELYLLALKKAGRSSSAVSGAQAAIAAAHNDMGLEGRDNPALSRVATDVVKAAMRTGKPQRQARALLQEDLRAITDTAKAPRKGRGGQMESKKYAEHRGAVDIALVLVLTNAGLRVSEAAGLKWGDFEWGIDGTGLLTVGRSKTNQRGVRQTVGITAGAANALEAIRPHVFDDDDLVFGMCPTQVRRRVKAAAKAAGLGDGFNGHSGRVGMARTMTANGAPMATIMRQGRWKNSSSVARYNGREEAAASVQWLANVTVKAT